MSNRHRIVGPLAYARVETERDRMFSEGLRVSADGDAALSTIASSFGETTDRNRIGVVCARIVAAGQGGKTGGGRIKPNGGGQVGDRHGLIANRGVATAVRRCPSAKCRITARSGRDRPISDGDGIVARGFTVAPDMHCRLIVVDVADRIARGLHALPVL